MYRDDIFYDGSIVHLPTYDRSSKATKSGSAQQSAVSSLSYIEFIILIQLWEFLRFNFKFLYS